MQLPCTCYSPHTSSTDAGLITQPDSLENRLLQLCAAWRSIRLHSEAPANPEQCSAYCSTSASVVRCQLAASDAALAACWTAHQLQVGCADVQESADIISAVSKPAHLVAHQYTQHSIVVRPTAVRAIWQTSFATRSFSTAAPLTLISLPSAVLNCNSLVFNPDLRRICFFYRFLNYSTKLLRQRLCSRLTALLRFINFVSLLSLSL